MEQTEEEELHFKKSEIYHICERVFMYTNTDEDLPEAEYDDEEDLSEAEFDECIDPKDDFDPDEDSVIDERYIKVRDHCHLTRKYRQGAHQICNINLKLPQNIPVFYHNMSGYDTHLLYSGVSCKIWENRSYN